MADLLDFISAGVSRVQTAGMLTLPLENAVNCFFLNSVATC